MTGDPSSRRRLALVVAAILLVWVAVTIPLAVGESRSKEWRLKFSLILRITDTEKLHRTLKKVFGSS